MPDEVRPEEKPDNGTRKGNEKVLQRPANQVRVLRWLQEDLLTRGSQGAWGQVQAPEVQEFQDLWELRGPGEVQEGERLRQ